MPFPTHSCLSLRPRYGQSGRRGVALVLVLSFLVIISGLIIAFFTNVTSEATSANLASASTTAKTLSDSAVNIVMSQITDATSGKDPSTGAVSGPGNAFAWASQPGMIRTYDNKGNPSFFYKLYSSDMMKFTGKSNLGSNDVTGDVTSLPTDWNSAINSDVYVDLNAPLADSLNYLHYPIADPRADATYTDPDAAQNPDSSKDPDFNNHVEGFQVARTGAASTTVFNTTANQLPMPVKWLYLLEDGTLCAPEIKGTTISIPKATPTNRIKGRVAFWTDDESSKVNINVASEGNYWDTPRIFSLEDVGIMLSAAYKDGTPPVANNPGLALCQPASKEYQRYPGHPAKTSLSVIFGGDNVLPWKGTLDPTKNASITSTSSFLKLDRYYDLTPRLAPGGSHSGTVAAAAPVVLDNDRFFSSIDELMFRNAFAAGNGSSSTGPLYRSVNATVDPGSTPNPNPSPSPGSTPVPPATGPAIPGAFGIRKNMLDKARFFITANSNAPEVNQYNLPRISMWPINDTNFTTNTAKYAAPHNLVLSPFDQLAAFCSSIGVKSSPGTENPKREYYFTRWNPRSMVDDLNITLGGQKRNLTIYKYLRSLTSLPVPGHVGTGNTFLTKYPGKGTGPSDRDQILTEVLDYVRCVNLGDTTVDPTIQSAPPNTPSTLPRTQYTPVSTLISLKPQTAFVVPGGGEVVPLRINLNNPTLARNDPANSTQGFGRIDTMGNAYLIFYGVHAEPNAEPNAMGVVFTMSTFCPAQGNKGYSPNISYRVKGLSSLFAASDDQADAPQPLNLPDNGIVHTAILGAFTWHGRGIGGTESPCLLFSNGLFGYNDTSYLSPNTRVLGNWSGANPKPENYYPFFSKSYVRFPTPKSRESAFFTLQSKASPNSPTGEITVDILNNTVPKDALTVDKTTPIQTLHFQFPKGRFRIPRLVNVADYGGANNKRADLDDAATATDLSMAATNAFNRYRVPSACGGANTDGFILEADTVVGLECAGPMGGNANNDTEDSTAGDYRMYAPLPDVTSPYFRPNKNYSLCGNLGNTQVYVTDISGSKAYNMMRATGQPTNAGRPQSGQYFGAQGGKLVDIAVPSDGRLPDVPSRVPKGGVTRVDLKPGDWDTGLGLHKDGAYINKPDEGDQGYKRFDVPDGSPPRYRIPYIEKEDYFASQSAELFSPNRQVSSPIMFGSLPTGVKAYQPWQTLLFHPMPEDTGKTHPGYQKVPDHYIADLFWMPVVDPYAISQPFSTAGKLNMNAEIQPFTYITRSTALRAAMKATKLMALSTTADYANYKPAFGEDRLFNNRLPSQSDNRRYSLNMDETMREFYEKKFGTGDLFHSASQICEVNLIPTGRDANGTTDDTIGAFWTKRTLTGDNLREAPYTDLYPRLTTKSNTFTVHVYAQALKKSSITKANEWVHGKDQVVAEYRGSSIIERYIDSNDPKLPDFADMVSKLDTLSDAQKATLNLDQYYKFRVISTRRFSP